MIESIFLTMISRTKISVKKFLQSTIVLLPIIVAIGCEWERESLDTANIAPRYIVNGDETNYEKWKGVVGLYILGDNSDSICTGTLIHPQVVLPAGHCVDKVNSGTSDVEIKGGANMEIHYTYASKIIIHEDWQGNIQDPYHVDLAMILLEEPITEIETYGISAIPLELRQTGFIVGYGNNSNWGGEQNHREGKSTVINLPLGDRIFEIDHPAGTCNGDSGGPFLVQEDDKWVVAGVTSYGDEGTCSLHKGNWDVRVQTYRGWIDNTLVQLTGQGLPPASNPIDNDTESEIAPFGMDSTNPVNCRSLPASTRSESSLFRLFKVSVFGR